MEETVFAYQILTVVLRKYSIMKKAKIFSCEKYNWMLTEI